MGRENRKVNLFIYCLNDWLADNKDNWEQQLLQTIFLPKKLEISYIDIKYSNTIFEKVIQANLFNTYYMKLYKIIKTSFSIEDINIYYLSDLAININNYICQFNCL